MIIGTLYGQKMDSASKVTAEELATKQKLVEERKQKVCMFM